MFCRRLYSLLLIIVLLSLAGTSCARKNRRAVDRLAILPFENLSSDVTLDWVSRAAGAALVYDLAGSPTIYAQPVESLVAADAVRASRIMQGYFFARNGQLTFRITITDARKVTTISNFTLDGPLAEGALPLINGLARRLSVTARPFGSRNPAAFRDYGEALEARDRAEVLHRFESAANADPRFAAAYLASARILLEGGDREQARKILTAAESAFLDRIDQVRLEYLTATARGDVAARVKALQALARVTPADWQVFRELADVQFSQRNFADAVRNYEIASRLDPENVQAWNQLGYAYAFAKNLTGARRALERYRQLLPPEEVNPLDSLGEVSFYLGDFDAAAKYFLQAQQKNPSEFGGGELVKAAQAHLMRGDLQQADALFQRYIGLLQNSQSVLAGYQLAQWEFLTGRRKAAIARLEKLIPSSDATDLRSLSLCQLSIWKLETGDSKAAADLAIQAEASAKSPQLRSLSATCRLLSAPPTGSTGSPVADAYILVFQRKFSEVTPALENLLRQINPTVDGQVRTLLAWANVETGHLPEAQRLLDPIPIPLSSGEQLFTAMIFPRLLYLRGAVLEKEGKRADAKRSYELFLKYAGDLPDIFGDEARARQSLGHL